jgi:hypothetical protein
MCPECIPAFTLMVAGCGSVASVILLFRRTFVRAFRKSLQSAAREKTSS